MQIIGIIAEYNPFHNGHKYHINTIKRRYPIAEVILFPSLVQGIGAKEDLVKNLKIKLRHTNTIYIFSGLNCSLNIYI